MAEVKTVILVVELDAQGREARTVAVAADMQVAMAYVRAHPYIERWSKIGVMDRRLAEYAYRQEEVLNDPLG